jgi:undecaprenyl-diphosphatase
MSKGQLAVPVRYVVDCDVALSESLNCLCRAHGIKEFFAWVSWLGDGIAWYALMLVLPALYGEPGVASSLNMGTVAVVNLAAYKAIKAIAGRPRPCMVYSSIVLGTAPLDQYSFPSGHTMHAVAFSAVAIAHHPELAWCLIPFTGLIAMSRVVLGLHYPSDVVAGALIGGVTACLLPWPENAMALWRSGGL